MQCYVDADEIVRKRKDAEMWQQGIYFMNAMSVALSRAIGGNKSKAKYLQEPILAKQQRLYDEENATEEEKQAERDKLLMRLQLMQTAFEANKEIRGNQG